MKLKMCVSVSLCLIILGTRATWAEAKGVEAAQLVTYVKPVPPPDLPAGGVHLVSFTAVLGSDGKLDKLVTTATDSTLVSAARAAASQWVYVPYKRKGKPIDKEVYVTVYVSGHDHDASVDHPVKVSSGLMARLAESVPSPMHSPGGSGNVVLQGTIARDGSVEDAKVMSGPGSLGEVALATVRRWTYKPFLMDGVPVEIETTMQVNFGR